MNTLKIKYEKHVHIIFYNVNKIFDKLGMTFI